MYAGYPRSSYSKQYVTNRCCLVYLMIGSVQPMCTLLWFVFVRNGSPASRLKVMQCHALVNGYSYPSVLFGAHGSFLRPPIGLLLINHTFSYLSYIDIMCNMFKNNAFDLCDHALHMRNRNIYWGTKVWNININFVVIKKQIKKMNIKTYA